MEGVRAGLFCSVEARQQTAEFTLGRKASRETGRRGDTVAM